MDSNFALGNLIHERLFGAREKKREAEAERLKNEASEATTLRKLMSLYEPERKDNFVTMDLPNLRGEVMAFTGKQRQMKEAKDAMSAKAMEELLAEFNQPNASEGDYLGETAGPAARPLNAGNLRAALPRHPGAATHANLPDLLRILQAGDLQEQDEEGGAPQILDGPFPGTKILTDRRGRSTPQVVRESKESDGYIELPDEQDPMYGPRIRVPLSQARKEYPHLLKRLGGSSASAPASAYKSADDVKAALKAGKVSRDDALKILREQFKMK